MTTTENIIKVIAGIEYITLERTKRTNESANLLNNVITKHKGIVLSVSIQIGGLFQNDAGLIIFLIPTQNLQEFLKEE